MSEERTEEYELVSLRNEGGVSVVPLGGVGEIGMNCMVYEYDGQIMLVDCGAAFPDACHEPGTAQLADADHV